MKRLAILLALCLGPPLLAQTQSPYLYTSFTPWTATATSQTSPVMNIGDANRPYNYASGTVNVVGSSLTTVTFAVQGSQDQGATYNSLVIQTCGTAGGTSTTITLTANGCAWVNLAGIDHVKFVTSSTFTATSVVFTLRANPNVNTIGAATSGGATGQSATFNNSGSGAASGATFNGSAPVTISYNTVGAAASTASTTVNGQTCTLGSTCTVPVAMTLISDQLLGSPAATVTFSSIPGTYKELRLFFDARCSGAVLTDNTTMQVNADTGANYSTSYSNSANTAYTTGTQVSVAAPAVSFTPCASALAGSASYGVIDFPDYAGTTFLKFARSTSSSAATASVSTTYLSKGDIEWFWNNTAAITSIVFAQAGGSNFVTGSRFTLYGIN